MFPRVPLVVSMVLAIKNFQHAELHKLVHSFYVARTTTLLDACVGDELSPDLIDLIVDLIKPKNSFNQMLITT